MCAGGWTTRTCSTSMLITERSFAEVKFTRTETEASSAGSKRDGSGIRTISPSHFSLVQQAVRLVLVYLACRGILVAWGVLECREFRVSLVGRVGPTSGRRRDGTVSLRTRCSS